VAFGIGGNVERDAGERPAAGVDLTVEGEIDFVAGDGHVEPLHDPRRLRLAAHRNAGPGTVAPVAAIQRPLVVGQLSECDGTLLRHSVCMVLTVRDVNICGGISICNRGVPAGLGALQVPEFQWM
jgi:hypothetical protein